MGTERQIKSRLVRVTKQAHSGLPHFLMHGVGSTYSCNTCYTSKLVCVSVMQFKPDVEATELAFAFPLPAQLSNIPLAKVCLPYILSYNYRDLKIIFSSLHMFFKNLYKNSTSSCPGSTASTSVCLSTFEKLWFSFYSSRRF